MSVKSKSDEAAQYFCDDRDNFIEIVFQEIWKFTQEFKKTVKVYIFRPVCNEYIIPLFVTINVDAGKNYVKYFMSLLRRRWKKSMN